MAHSLTAARDTSPGKHFKPDLLEKLCLQIKLTISMLFSTPSPTMAFCIEDGTLAAI